MAVIDETGTASEILAESLRIDPYGKDLAVQAAVDRAYNGLPCVVVSFTKATIACLAGPSFQEGSGSA